MIRKQQVVIYNHKSLISNIILLWSRPTFVLRHKRKRINSYTSNNIGLNVMAKKKSVHCCAHCLCTQRQSFILPLSSQL